MTDCEELIFQPGTKVRVRRDSREMHVIGPGVDRAIICAWASNGETLQQSFPRDCLDLVEDDAGPFLCP